jgi:DNA-binding MurR/RpiR family transcriptional regulator
VWQLVYQQLPRLAPAEKKVARVLLASYPIAGLETVTDLAERAGVSGPTVTRFVTALGFDGYRAFQQQLHQEVQARTSSPSVRYPAHPPRHQQAADVLDEHRRDAAGVLTATFDGLTRQDFNAAVELLADERRPVFCVGGRISHAAAQYLFARVHQLRPGCRLLDTGPTPLHDHLLDLKGREVVVAFDYRRYQTALVDFAHRAADQGATVVLLTDRWLSPIADVATHILVSESQTRSPFDSLLGCIGLVEALTAALIDALGERAQERITRIERLTTPVTESRSFPAGTG